MTDTPRLGLPLVYPAQAQKHVTVNEAFSRLDALTELRIESVGLTLPPQAVSEGTVFGIGQAAAGVWSGKDGQLALFSNGGWSFIAPQTGWRAWSVEEGCEVLFDGTEWVPGAGALGANGAGFVHRTLETDHAIQPGVTSTITGFLPANAIVYGITGRVLSQIEGAASMDIGVAESLDRYGSGIGTMEGAWARGLTGSPLTYYTATDLVIGAVGGVFLGTGVFRVAVHFAELTLPRA